VQTFTMNVIKALWISMLLVGSTYSSFSQDTLATKNTSGTPRSSEQMTTWQIIKYDGLSVYGGVKHAYTQPLKWKEKDWALFGGVVAGTMTLLALDEPANDYFTNQAEGVPDFVQETGFRFGKPLVNYGLTTGIYAIGLVTKNEKIRKTGVLLIASATAGGVFQTFTKTLIGRARPNTNEGNLSFRLWSNEAGFHSFPSGHTILSISTAHALAKQFKNPYVKGGIYAIGLLSPVSRLWSGAHWLTDVVLGAAISIAVVDSVDNYLKKEQRYAYNPKKTKIRWNLSFGAGQVGVVGRF